MENSTKDRSDMEKLLKISDDTQLNHEVSEEFSLPDYVPEIRKLLVVRACALPESKYISQTSAPPMLEIAGTVTYSVIYTSEDGELCALPLNSSYEAKTPISSNGSVFVDTEVESCNARVMAKRKLNIKTKLKSRVLGFSEEAVGETITPRSSADEMYIERKTKEVESVSVLPISLEHIRMSDKIDTTGLSSVKPIWCDASMALNDVRIQNGSVSVRGEATVKCLCMSLEGEKTLLKSVPIVEEIEAEGAMLNDFVSVVPRCVSLSISNSENQEGNELFFDLECELVGEVLRNSEAVLTTDAYSTKNEMETAYKEIDLYRGVKSQNASVTISEAMKREKAEISKIIEIIADPVYEKSEIKGNKINLLGKLFTSIVGKTEPNEQGECEYLSETYELPIKYEADLGKVNGEIIARCTFLLGNLSARYDNERIYITAEVMPAYSIYERTKDIVLDKGIINKDVEYKRDSACVYVTFPRENDNLWDVAKRYHISVNNLAQKNGISKDEISLPKSLII
ncbi:MAG: LysM peptidoglycan-binding domain-containing protein [Clostridia bacterium]|nr:LysM peptidoglycan-binding domain-containing protein [Clostridia bacterium]